MHLPPLLSFLLGLASPNLARLFLCSASLHRRYRLLSLLALLALPCSHKLSQSVWLSSINVPTCVRMRALVLLSLNHFSSCSCSYSACLPPSLLANARVRLRARSCDNNSSNNNGNNNKSIPIATNYEQLLGLKQQQQQPLQPNRQRPRRRSRRQPVQLRPPFPRVLLPLAFGLGSRSNAANQSAYRSASKPVSQPTWLPFS